MKKQPPPGEIRIVAGEWRGRKLAVPPGDAVRPTGERQRKALFDILGHGRYANGGVSMLVGARVLDAFAGTGALGLEALSRGAASCLFLDKAAASRAVCSANVANLGANARARVLAADACDPGAAPVAPFAPCNLVLLDAPYRSGFAATALGAFAARGWLVANAVCVVELALDESAAPPDGFVLDDERVYGQTKFLLLRYASS
jgi:16S rRNA (guanine966-N2)-methyltransferase